MFKYSSIFRYFPVTPTNLFLLFCFVLFFCVTIDQNIFIGLKNNLDVVKVGSVNCLISVVRVSGNFENSHYNLSPHFFFFFFFLLTWSVKWSNIVYKMISPKIKLSWGDTNTLKFANTSRVYFRLGQPEYTSLTQKFNNEVRDDLALYESNVYDIRPFWWRQLWSQFYG